MTGPFDLPGPCVLLPVFPHWDAARKGDNVASVLERGTTTASLVMTSPIPLVPNVRDKKGPWVPGF